MLLIVLLTLKTTRIFSKGPQLVILDSAFMMTLAYYFVKDYAYIGYKSAIKVLFHLSHHVNKTLSIDAINTVLSGSYISKGH